MQRLILSACLTLLPAAACLGAADPAVKAPVVFTMSQAEVTNDPRYTERLFVRKWPHINVAEAKRVLGQPGVVFVDGRSYGEWEASRIPGAVSMPIDEFDKRFPPLKHRLIHAKLVVTYCHGEGCAIADNLAQLIAEKGLRNVAVFWGGYPAWLEAKLPLEGTNANSPLLEKKRARRLKVVGAPGKP